MRALQIAQFTMLLHHSLKRHLAGKDQTNDGVHRMFPIFVYFPDLDHRDLILINFPVDFPRYISEITP